MSTPPPLQERGSQKTQEPNPTSCFPAPTPAQAWGHSWSPDTTHFPGQVSPLVGLKRLVVGSSCLTPPLPGGKPRTLSPPGHHLVTAMETSTKWGCCGCARAAWLQCPPPRLLLHLFAWHPPWPGMSSSLRRGRRKWFSEPKLGAGNE